MNYVLVFRLEARNELDDAYSWYENQQLGLGDDFLEQVEDSLARICEMPESYPVVYRDVRRLPPVGYANGGATISLHYLLSDRIEQSHNHRSLSWTQRSNHLAGSNLTNCLASTHRRSI